MKKRFKKEKNVKLIVLTKVTIKKTVWLAARRQHNAAETMQYLNNLSKMDQFHPKNSTIFIQQRTHTCFGEKKTKTTKTTNQTPQKIQQSPPAFCAHTGLKLL